MILSKRSKGPPNVKPSPKRHLSKAQVPFYVEKEARCSSMSNARYQNGSLRRKYRARFKAMDAPCGICRGRFGPIHYDEPSDAQHPMSFVIDEINPISKYAQFGYSSKREAAEDWNNLQAAHYWCNALKSDKTNFSLAWGTPTELRSPKKEKENILDGDW